jgi:alpha-L-fucosidase
MGMPHWWARRRFGLFVHANLATVPAWSPIGQYSDWYWAHLGDDLPDKLLHDDPLVEVLAHHRDRWGHIERFDDFLPLLTFDRFDAEEWARLAVDAGAGYTVLVAKHHDGWCWWDAPHTERSFVRGGPGRDVLREYAAACERNDVVFGTYYSLLDWGDPRYPGPAYVTDVLHAHVTDLVERFGSRVLWGDGHWGHGPDHWRSAALLRRLRDADPELVVNDRWWLTDRDLPAGGPPVVRTFEYAAPPDILREPWELCRGIGHSFCHNRAERAEHHMTAAEIVALYTEVLAKGGHLLLNVGPAADGTIPELQARPLRAAGRWITGPGAVVAAAEPWRVWGDEPVRYLVVDDVLHAVDLDGRGHFPALVPRRHQVDLVERLAPVPGDGRPRASTPGTHREPVAFRQDTDGLWIEPARRRPPADDVAGIPVYRLRVADAERPIELFETPSTEPQPLGPIVEGAGAGDIVQLGEGVYTGPARVPAHVVLRGLGPGRTTVVADDGPALRLAAGARAEHLAVGSGQPRVLWFTAPAVELDGVAAAVLGCTVDGHVVVRADDAVIRATRAAGVVVGGADRVCVSHCELRGNRWDVGIRLDGGEEHVVDSCEIVDHLCAVRAVGTSGSEVHANDVTARWCGVQLRQTERAHVHANRFRRTMRAIHVVGGTLAVIDGNAVLDGDSGCVLEAGAAACRISGNHWERCRIGLLAWEAGELRLDDNHGVDLHEPEHAEIIGP